MSLTSIKSLFLLDTENHKTYDISTEFQITKIQKQEAKNLAHGELYTLTLSDLEYSYSKFIYCKTSDSPELEIGKYINIKKICPMILEAHKEKAFLIKELELLPKESLIHIKSPPYIEKQFQSNSNNNKNISSQNNNKNISNNNNSQNQDIVSQDSEFMSYNTNKDREDEEFYYNNVNGGYNGLNSISYTPLKQLSTLTQDYKLLIKIVNKGEIKEFHSGKGKLFCCTIMDEFGSKMQVVAFDKMVDKYRDEIQENNIYEITGGYLRNSDKRYDLSGSDYKLILNETSSVTKKNSDEINFKEKFVDKDKKFLNIREVKEANLNSIVNVICVVGDKGETTYKETKSGSQLIRKTTILDQSNEKMELTLWRNFTQLNINNGDVLICKKVRVNDFGGKNITTTNDSKIFINPNISTFTDISKELQALKLFSEQNELSKGIIEINNTVKETKEENNNNNNNNGKIVINNINIIKKEYNDKIVYIDYILSEMNKYSQTDIDHRFPFYKIRAIVTHLGHTEKNFYPGCPNRECNRKVSFSNGDWICQYCRQSFKVPRYYYSLNIRVKDCSSEYWIDIFGKPAEFIMNVTADDYRNILINRDEQKLSQISESIEYKEFYFLLKVRLNRFNENTKKKFTANKIERIIKKNDIERVVNEIKKKIKIG